MHPYTACWRVVGIVWSCGEPVTKMKSDGEVVVDACAIIIALTLYMQKMDTNMRSAI